MEVAMEGVAVGRTAGEFGQVALEGYATYV